MLFKMRRDLDEEHGEEPQHRVQRERIITEMQHDERLACARSPSGGGPQGTTEMQVEGRALQALAQAVQGLSEMVLQLDYDTRARSSNGSMEAAVWT